MTHESAQQRTQPDFARLHNALDEAAAAVRHEPSPGTDPKIAFDQARLWRQIEQLRLVALKLERRVQQSNKR